MRVYFLLFFEYLKIWMVHTAWYAYSMPLELPQCYEEKKMTPNDLYWPIVDSERIAPGRT